MRRTAAVGVWLSLLFVAVAGETTIETKVLFLTEPSGEIVAPPGSGDNHYLPNARYLWIIDLNYTDINIDVQVLHVDLGAPSLSIHDSSRTSYTSGDFLLVGAGDDILGGEEIMFYGQRQKEKTVVVRSGVAHVFFYSSTTSFNATGFTIFYNSTAMVTTEAPPTTEVPALPPLGAAFLAINGIPLEEWAIHNQTLKQAVTNMANDFLSDHSDVNSSYVLEVTPDDVLINDIKTCRTNYCWRENCVAYNLSVDMYYGNDVPVFDDDMMNEMFAHPDMENYINSEMGADFVVCDEHPSVTKGVSYIAIPICIVVFGIAAAMTVWKLSYRTSNRAGTLMYEQQQREKMDDERKLSMRSNVFLGFGGGSLASRNSRNSRRFTMPFPKDHRLDEEEDEEVKYDVTDFINYNPDLGMADPRHLGLEQEFTRSGRPMQPYANQAFVADEALATTIQRKSFEAPDTDTDDSGDGDALTFNSKRLTPMKVPAEYHASDTNMAHETVL